MTKIFFFDKNEKKSDKINFSHFLVLFFFFEKKKNQKNKKKKNNFFFLIKKKSKKIKKKMNNFFLIFFFSEKLLIENCFQNIFWIDCGSGEHKKKFLEVERVKER